MNLDKAIEFMGVDRCEFDDECDYCNKPMDGSYVQMSDTPDGREANFYICGWCLPEVADREEKRLEVEARDYEKFNDKYFQALYA